MNQIIEEEHENYSYREPSPVGRKPGSTRKAKGEEEMMRIGRHKQIELNGAGMAATSGERKTDRPYGSDAFFDNSNENSLHGVSLLENRAFNSKMIPSRASKNGGYALGSQDSVLQSSEMLSGLFSDKNHGLKYFENEVQMGHQANRKMRSMMGNEQPGDTHRQTSRKREEHLSQASVLQRSSLMDHSACRMKEVLMRNNCKLKDVPESATEVLVKFNHEGMSCLSTNDFKEALEYLKLAEELVFQERLDDQDRKQMTALTFNNLGCYYKKVKKPKVAYRYMLKALELEEQCDLPESHLASTKLNICAILSSMSKHTEAVQYANSACSDLIEALKLIKIKCLPDDKMNRAVEHFSINLKKLAHADPGNRPLLHQTLSIAYYNLAVEFEYIQNFEEAMKTQSKAKYFANLTGNFSFVTQIEASITQIQRKVKNQQQRLEKKSIYKEAHQASSSFMGLRSSMNAASQMGLSSQMSGQDAGQPPARAAHRKTSTTTTASNAMQKRQAWLRSEKVKGSGSEQRPQPKAAHHFSCSNIRATRDHLLNTFMLSKSGQRLSSKPPEDEYHVEGFQNTRKKNDNPSNYDSKASYFGVQKPSETWMNWTNSGSIRANKSSSNGHVNYTQPNLKAGSQHPTSTEPPGKQITRSKSQQGYKRANEGRYGKQLKQQLVDFSELTDAKNQVMSVKELVSFDDSAELHASISSKQQTFGPAGDSQKEADANMNVSEEFSLAPEVLSNPTINTRVKTISIVDEKVSQESSLHRPHMPGQEIQVSAQSKTNSIFEIKDIKSVKSYTHVNQQDYDQSNAKSHEHRSGSDNARAELMNARPDYGRDKRDAMQFMMTTTSKRLFEGAAPAEGARSTGMHLRLGALKQNKAPKLLRAGDARSIQKFDAQLGVYSGGTSTPVEANGDLAQEGIQELSQLNFLNTRQEIDTHPSFDWNIRKSCVYQTENQQKTNKTTGRASTFLNNINIKKGSGSRNQAHSTAQLNKKRNKPEVWNDRQASRNNNNLNAQTQLPQPWATQHLSNQVPADGRQLSNRRPILISNVNGNVNINFNSTHQINSCKSLEDREQRLKHLRQYASTGLNQKKFITGKHGGASRGSKASALSQKRFESDEEAGPEFFAVSK